MVGVYCISFVGIKLGPAIRTVGVYCESNIKSNELNIFIGSLLASASESDIKSNELKMSIRTVGVYLSIKTWPCYEDGRCLLE